MKWKRWTRDIVPVVVVSTMRSGSTLLKSLLATAPSVSDLPETNFQRYHALNAWKLRTMCDAKYIVMKFPASFHDHSYPRVPNLRGLKKIVLVRDVYSTVKSLSSMIRTVHPELIEVWPTERLVSEYWFDVNKRIIRNCTLDDQDTMLIRYEDLIQDPIEITGQLFEWMGMIDQPGVDRYNAPLDYEWTWGSDDGGDKIKSLKVSMASDLVLDPEICSIIGGDSEMRSFRASLGYI